MVLDTQCDMIANLKTVAAQQIADLVCRIVKLFVGQNRASSCVYNGGLIWIQCCIMSWEHGGNGSP